MFNQALSVELFKELTNGRVINKYKLQNNGEETENELFTEVMSNLDTYRLQYRMSGYELIEHEDYFYIRDADVGFDDLQSDITMKVSVLLILLGKYVNDKGYILSKLTSTAGGLSDADLDEIETLPNTIELMEKCDFKKGFKHAFKSSLVDRNIMLQKPTDGRYVLSAAGRAFFAALTC